MQLLYPVPASSVVTQTFAEHVHAARLNGWTNYNGGVDWAVPTGTPIVAAQAGQVNAARRDATGYGTHLRIQHEDGYETIYGHMLDFAVKVGDKIGMGQVIGRSDNTGNSTGPHLHFELRKNGVPIDPMLLLTAQAAEEEAPAIEPGEWVYLRPFYNLRAGPSTASADIGTTEATIDAEVVAQEGDWLKVRLTAWIHKGGVQ